MAGSVLLWGKVIEGSFGYRAQYAYPERLWLLPPARVGGEDKTRIDERTVVTAGDLLVTLRHRYCVPVGYAAHDSAAADLLAGDEVGWFYSWRLTATGKDRFERQLGEIGRPATALPTVDDALDLWLANHPHDRSRRDREHVRRHLRPAFGHIPIDQPDQIDQIHYAPTSTKRGQLYGSRTIARHRSILRQAITLAGERWLIERASET